MRLLTQFSLNRMTNSILRAVLETLQLENSSSMGLLIGEKLISMEIRYGDNPKFQQLAECELSHPSKRG